MSSSKRTIRWSQALGVALLAGATPTGDAHAAAGRARPSSARSAASETNRLSGLQVVEGKDGTVTLRLSGSVPPTYNVYRLSEPDRLVVDLAHARRHQVVPRLSLDTWSVGGVTVEEVEDRGAPAVRVTVALKRPASYIVVPDGSMLSVTVTPREAPPEAYFARKSAAERRAEIEAAELRAKEMASRARMLEAEAAAKVTRAEQRAEAARKAEAEAKAEARRARRELARARLGKRRIRKQIARAEAARKAAERARAEAEAELRRARSRAEEDRARAAAMVRRAEQMLAEARRTKATAERTLAEAERARAEAQATLARAQSKARQAQAALVRARKAEAEALRKRKQAEARARARSSQELQAAVAAARKAEAEARKARRTAEEERDRARAEVAALRAEAEHVRKAAAADRARAAEVLARAEREMQRARAEQEAARRARAEAEAALAKARRAAASARRGKAASAKKKAIDRAVAQARLAARRAAEREKQARTTLARLAADRDRLARMLEEQTQANARLLAAKAKAEAERDAARSAHAKALHKAQEAERRRLAALEAKLAAAQKALDARLSKLERARSRGDGKLAETWRAQRKALGKTKVTDVRFEQDAGGERIVLRAEGPVEFESVTLTPTVHMLRVKGAELPKKLERSFDASSYGGPVRTVTAFSEGRDVKVVVSAQAGVVPRAKEAGGGLVWTFPATQGVRAASKAPAPVAVPAPKVGAYATGAPSSRASAASAAAPASGLPSSAPQRSGRRRKWRGERIDIELQDAPIKDVLLLFSDIGRVNIIAGQGVEGTVTMKLTAVPWDQALDIILRSLGLGMVREGNVIRVATLQDIEEERRKAIEAANARVQLKPLETRLVPVSYATVDEMIPKVQSVLSPRGTVTPDSRTNTLIIMDVAENIALAEQLVGQLDSQTPQVLIEARIVEARTSFLRQLGIQWGLGFIASPGTGNPTGLLFPNSIGIGGGASGRPPDTRGLLLPGAAQNPNYAVDLPAPVGTGAGGALGFTFGNISGNLQTNLRLSAAEDTGEVRIISAPKIVTLDNTQAQIEQGVQIPISQVSAQGVNTRYVNATLGLRVTPHVTNEGAVLLDVQVQKNEADFVNTGARGDPTILTKQARSRMLVNDGDTAVIGGIYTRNKSVNFKKVPWIADIPIIGWFFKNKTEADTRTEVLIFLTPRIVNRASSIGG